MARGLQLNEAPGTDFPSIFARSYYKPELFIDTAEWTLLLSRKVRSPMRKLHRILISSLVLAASAFAQSAGALFPMERLILQADEEAVVQPGLSYFHINGSLTAAPATFPARLAGAMGLTFQKPVLQTPLS
jgi:hypothetical protein